MQDPFPIPLCFAASGGKFPDDPMSAFAATKSGQSVVTSVYRTKIAGLTRLITISWCRNLLVHGLCIAVEGPDYDNTDTNMCKVELRPWCFWRKTGSKRLNVRGVVVKVVWDLHDAKFCGETEPRSDYYVALVHDDEEVLRLGDRRTGFRPAAIKAALVSRKEHVFGRKRFATRTKFDDKGTIHDITIECRTDGDSDPEMADGDSDPEMAIWIDGNVAVHVKHLQWKFRGNETVVVSKDKIEVYWDVHDMLFSPGLRHALFIFKPTVLTSSLPHGLFLYAWKLE